MGVGGKYTEFDTAPDSAHSLVVQLVPSGARVLEFGCATGYMSEVLRSRLGCSVTGVELSAEAGELARKHCERVIVGDAESLDFHEILRGERFDTILFADVLEHLREPGAVLCRLRPFLAEGGSVVASIPNIAHGSVRLALLNGEFRYRDVGLLDSTHLRFFTRESIQDLFEGTGYFITNWVRRRVDIDNSEITVPFRQVPVEVQKWLAEDPEATTYQFVIRAVPAEAAEALRQARAEVARMRSELGAAQLALQEALGASAPNAGDTTRAGRVLTWTEELALARQEIAVLIPPGSAVILVDDQQWTGEVAGGRRVLPFLERDGEYWGAPADDDVAIRELERLRQSGAGFIVFARPALWWLDYYSGLSRHLHAKFRCLLTNDRLVVFDLRL